MGKKTMKKFAFMLVGLVMTACAVPTATVQAPARTPVETEQTYLPSLVPSVVPRLTATPTTPATPLEAAVDTTPTPLPLLHAGQALTIMQLYQMNASFGWGMEPGGHLLRTANEGETWRDVSPPAGTISTASFFPLTAKTAWVAPVSWCPADPQGCNPPRRSLLVWQTIDGGKSWQSGQPIPLGGAGDERQAWYISPSLSFLDLKNGWLLAELHRDAADVAGIRKLFRTADGGATWQLLADENGLPPSGTGLVFVDPFIGWMGASSQVDVPSLYQTLDGGQTWALHPFATLAMSAEYQPCHTRPTYIFWRSVGINVLCNDGAILFYTWTSSTGEIWRAWQASGNEFFLDTQRGWRMFSPGLGQHTMLQKTVDGGRRWGNLRSVDWQSVQLDFTDDNLGWGVARISSRIALVHTSDGGRTWVEFKPVIANR